MRNPKPLTVFLVVAAVTVVLSGGILFYILQTGNLVLLVSQSCNAGMQSISCNGRIGELRGTSRIDFYDEGTSVSFRSSNWNAVISITVEEGDLFMNITNLAGEVESYTITPDNPLDLNIAVDRSLSGKISAQLSTIASSGESSVVRGINWQADFSAR